MKTMYNEHGFDERNFLQDAEGLIDKRTLLENIVEYAHKYKHISKDQFAEAVSDMTGIEFENVIQFCNDEILTSTSIEKRGDIAALVAAGAEFKKGFAGENFLQYAMDAVSLEEILEHALQEFYRYENVSKDQLAESVSEITGCAFRKAAKYCDDSLLTKYGQREKDIANGRRFLSYTMYSSEVQAEELRIAEELIGFVEEQLKKNPEELLASSCYRGKDLEQDIAESLETEGLERLQIFLTPYREVSDDAEELLMAICRLKRTQMEELREEPMSHKDCLEIAIGRATRESIDVVMGKRPEEKAVPFELFGRCLVVNTLDVENGKYNGTLYIDGEKVAELAADGNKRQAAVSFTKKDLPQKTIEEITEAYRELGENVVIEAPKKQKTQDERC